ncbi:MAG: phosphonoacetaldehyde hydrolase [Bacillota bacterium]|nr:phosphonoacetaldehyde hydrolase [Bacillota bacterium]
MTKISAVIFDWAGTTVDYGSFAPIDAFMKAFKRHGIEPTLDEVRQPMGLAKREHVRSMLATQRLSLEWLRIHGRAFSEEDVEAIYRESERQLLALLPRYAEPKPHVVETIQELRAGGIKIGSTTGYTAQMMEIVLPEAARAGYSPDACFTPDATEQLGRPWPFMIFANMKKLRILSVAEVLKVGDTIADIKEGQNAGVVTVGVLEGSSLMGLTEEEYQALSPSERDEARAGVRALYQAHGADHVINNMSELPALIRKLEAAPAGGCGG